MTSPCAGTEVDFWSHPGHASDRLIQSQYWVCRLMNLVDGTWNHKTTVMYCIFLIYIYKVRAIKQKNFQNGKYPLTWCCNVVKKCVKTGLFTSPNPLKTSHMEFPTGHLFNHRRPTGIWRHGTLKLKYVQNE